MKNGDCVEFLQWALPRLHMRWPGFRRVRNQVCKHIDRRMKTLQLDGIEAYRTYLSAHPEEWTTLDSLTRITISRFYRDRWMFDQLERLILPDRAREAAASHRSVVGVCSLGSGSGEEPYSVSLLWCLRLQSGFPEVRIRILAVDADARLLERARKACYEPGSMKELPADLRASGFIETAEGPCLRPEYRRPVKLLRHDVREGVPDGPYDIVLCRNLAFTYFDEPLQACLARHIHEALRPGGVLVTGGHERLPEGHSFRSGSGGRYFHWKPAAS